MTPLPAPARPVTALSLSGDRAKRGRPLVMGILNVTPDSFYGGSRVPRIEDAVRRAREMEEAGVDILDVGGESTRPGSAPASPEEEARRVLPVVESLAREARVPISIDTSKPLVAERAFDAGATILNDVLAMRGDSEMPAVAVRYPVVVLMHMLGRSPRTMQADPRYKDVVGEISSFLRGRLDAFTRAGGDPARVWLDPGIGFGKTLEHNIEIMARLEEFASLGRPLLIGASRKSFIGSILGRPGEPALPEARLEGSLAAACRAAEAGAVCVRVHDVAETLRALEVWARIGGGGAG
ncbi:MAG: dihydropteroate synthase [Elusimicrobiota bacterium]